MTPLLEGTMVRDPAQRWSMVEVRDFLAPALEPDVRPPAASHDGDDDSTRVLAASAPAATAERPRRELPREPPPAPRDARPTAVAGR